MEISNTSQIKLSGINAVIYGESGIGKTTLASTLEGKTLIISCESGLLSLSKSQIDYVEIQGKSNSEKISHLRKLLLEIQKGVPYDNIFIDSLSEINQIIIGHHFDQVNNDLSKTLQVWGEVSKTMRAIIRAFRDLKKYNVIMTALVKTEKDEIGRRFLVPDLSGKLGNQVSQYMDEVFYYAVIHKDDKDERILITQSSSNIIAKDRSGKLGPKVKPNLTEIFKEIRK